MSEDEYRSVKVSHGARGWGGPLIITPKPGKHLIYSVTGGGIHPVAQRIADLTGGTPFDGFKSKAEFEEIAVAVIDCGGTARVGVYPMKGVLTIDIHAAKPSGPLFRYIKEDNFVSGVDIPQIELLDGYTPAPETEVAAEPVAKPEKIAPVAEKQLDRPERTGWKRMLFGP